MDLKEMVISYMKNDDYKKMIQGLSSKFELKSLKE